MSRFLCCIAFVMFAGHGSAQDWPQWLGPTRDGKIDDTIEPWKKPLEAVWSVPVGDGHSSPIVAQGMVFLHHKPGNSDEETLTAWDLSGKKVWEVTNPRDPFKSEFGVGPRATPSYSDGKIYSLGVTGILICRDAATGKEIWSKPLLAEFKAKNLYFGVSSSPLVDGNYVYVMPGGELGSIVALNKKTGDLVWKSGTDRASYSSPTITVLEGRKLLVFQTERGVVGLDPATGKEQFRIPLKDLLNESSTTPVRIGDMLFASSVTFGSIGIKLSATEPVASQAWKNNKLTCYFGTPVEFDGSLYAVTGQIVNPTATLHCIDPKTGQSLWSKKGVGTYHATLLRTREKLLILEEKGDLVMVQPSKEGYQELARSPLCKMTWAHPAYAQGMLFIRDSQELKAIKLK